MIVGIILSMLLCQQSAQQFTRHMVGHQLLFQTGAHRYHPHGFKLTFQDVTAVGLPAICVDALIVTVTICGGILMGRLLRMDRGIALLIGGQRHLWCRNIRRRVGNQNQTLQDGSGCYSSCHLRNCLHVSPSILYRSGVFALPPDVMGIFTGSTIHGWLTWWSAGNAMGKAVSDTAIIVKMIRVMMLVPVLLVISYCVARAALKNNTEDATKGRHIQIPWFCHSLSGRHWFQLIQSVARGWCRSSTRSTHSSSPWR